MLRVWTPENFAATLDHLAITHGASITSTRRTAARNKAVGGRPDSLHMSGLAGDLVPDDLRQAPAVVVHAQALGLEAFIEADHVHIETPPPRTWLTR